MKTVEELCGRPGPKSIYAPCGLPKGHIEPCLHDYTKIHKMRLEDERHSPGCNEQL